MNPDLSILLAWFGFFVLVAVVAVVTKANRQRALEEPFPDMAPRRAGWFGSGGVTAEYRGARLRVFGTSAFGGSGEEGPPRLSDAVSLTVFQAELPVPLPGRVFVLRDILLPQFQRRNLADVKLGDPEFDPMFLVEESAPGMAARVLAEPVRRATMALWRRSSQPLGMRSSGLAVTIAGPTLFVCFEETTDPEIWARARALVVAVLETLGLVKALPEAGERPAGEAHCLVCGGALEEEPVVACSKCGTQHHRACLEYLGRCAVFGCDARARS